MADFSDVIFFLSFLSFHRSTRLGSSAFLSIGLAALGLLLYIAFIHILLFGSDRFFLTNSFPYVSLSQATAFSKIPKMHLKPTEYIGLGLGQSNGEFNSRLLGLSDPTAGFSLGKLPVRRGLEALNEGKDREATARIFHVTKEFGDAQFGGLGSIVTNLALVQKEQGEWEKPRGKNTKEKQIGRVDVNSRFLHFFIEKEWMFL